MALKTIVVGALEVCCYVVAANGAPGCVVIDPGDDAAEIAALLKETGLVPEMILLTHAHADHIGAVDELLALYPGAALAASGETLARAADPRLNLSVYLGETIVVASPGRALADGERFSAGGLEWEAREIPGHDPGELAYILAAEGAVFSGDVVFAGSIGRSDFPGGDGAALVAGARRLLESVPPETRIFPGHGPDTTAGAELEHNPFLNFR